jgi:hypothetical protein
LEKAMDVVEKGTSSLMKASRHWNIALTSLFNRKIRSIKAGSTNVLITKKDQAMVS